MRVARRLLALRRTRRPPLRQLAEALLQRPFPSPFLAIPTACVAFSESPRSGAPMGRRFRGVDLSRRRASSPPFSTSRGRIFPVSFSSSFKSSEGLAPFVALDVSVLRANFSRRRQPRASKWADPKEPHPSPAHEPRVGSQQKRAVFQENNVRTSSPNAFRAYVFTDGRQPFVPAASRNASLL